MSKFYAVRNGRVPGIYSTWDQAKQQVHGHSGAIYKSFPTLELAQEFMTPAISAAPTSVMAEIYTDGSCINRYGGYGIVHLEAGQVKQTYKGRVPINPCTNQIAELYAIYMALKTYSAVNPLKLYTDSQYSIGCVTEWCKVWVQNGWQTSSGKAVANQELIRDILELHKNRTVIYEYVPGHRGYEFNELADALANEGLSMQLPESTAEF